MDWLFCGRGRTRRSGESANKSGRAKRELSTGGGGRANYSPENYSPESSQANDSSENCLADKQDSTVTEFLLPLACPSIA